MATLAGVAYWPADTSEPVLELTTGDLLREAAADAGTQTAIAEAAPPGAPSLAGADRTGRRWTYQELLAQAEQCAHWLLTQFSPGERITIWAPNIPEWIILQYGAALAGLIVVTANPALRAPELRYVLEQSRSAGLFHTAAFRGSDMAAIAEDAATGLPELRALFCFTHWRATVGAHHGGGSLPAVRPGDAAQIQYTSGTTGFPKGALLHHRGVVTNARFMIGRTQLPHRGTMVSASRRHRAPRPLPYSLGTPQDARPLVRCHRTTPHRLWKDPEVPPQRTDQPRRTQGPGNRVGPGAARANADGVLGRLAEAVGRAH